MAYMEFNAVPGPCKITKTGTQVNLAVGDDMSTDDYKLFLDTPCRVTIETIAEPAGDVMVDDSAIEDGFGL